MWVGLRGDVPCGLGSAQPVEQASCIMSHTFRCSNLFDPLFCIPLRCKVINICYIAMSAAVFQFNSFLRRHGGPWLPTDVCHVSFASLGFVVTRLLLSQCHQLAQPDECASVRPRLRRERKFRGEPWLRVCPCLGCLFLSCFVATVQLQCPS